jgi:hypothetical protein
MDSNKELIAGRMKKENSWFFKILAILFIQLIQTSKSCLTFLQPDGVT